MVPNEDEDDDDAELFFFASMSRHFRMLATFIGWLFATKFAIDAGIVPFKSLYQTHAIQLIIDFLQKKEGEISLNIHQLTCTTYWTKVPFSVGVKTYPPIPSSARTMPSSEYGGQRSSATSAKDKQTTRFLSARIRQWERLHISRWAVGQTYFRNIL